MVALTPSGRRSPLSGRPARVVVDRPGQNGGMVPILGAARSHESTRVAWIIRAALSWACGAAGLLAYNWWALALLKPGLITSPDELFSNLEVTGRPYAVMMQHADLLSGLLLLVAFLAAGSKTIAGGRREWLAMIVYAAAGLVGGAFPETCADSLSASCKDMEVRLQLPTSQYVHVIAGIVEFAGITVALLLAERRTKGQRTTTAATYRLLTFGALGGYPVLGVAYLSGRLGGVVEAAFFIGFTVIVLAQLAERTGWPNGPGHLAHWPGRPSRSFHDREGSVGR